KAWLEAPIMAFGTARATKAWMGRVLPSRHNISAPDMVFSGFAGENMNIGSEVLAPRSGGGRKPSGQEPDRGAAAATATMN
ncbi:MAG: hypothetical protein WB610_12620, partial [Rhodomicrobium sp.]